MECLHGNNLHYRFLLGTSIQLLEGKRRCLKNTSSPIPIVMSKCFTLLVCRDSTHTDMFICLWESLLDEHQLVFIVYNGHKTYNSVTEILSDVAPGTLGFKLRQSTMDFKIIDQGEYDICS